MCPLKRGAALHLAKLRTFTLGPTSPKSSHQTVNLSPSRLFIVRQPRKQAVLQAQQGWFERMALHPGARTTTWDRPPLGLARDWTYGVSTNSISSASTIVSSFNCARTTDNQPTLS